MAQTVNNVPIDNSFEESLGIKFDERGNRLPRFRSNENRNNIMYYSDRELLTIALFNTTASKRSDYLRPRRPKPGTLNWKKTSNEGTVPFTGRNGHATTVFRCPLNADGSDSGNCIWLTGGRSEEYQTYDLRFSHRNADVWYSENGGRWIQQISLTGDFIDGIGNFNARHPGPTAPWYSRYGHSLDAMDCNNDGINDAMVLFGGYNPEPSNDMWISVDGTKWVFDGFAPWSKRAWHSSTMFKGQLYVVGGSPLTNDIWVGNLTIRDGMTFVPENHLTDTYGNLAYNLTMVWKQKVQTMHPDTPFAPRSGHCIISQLRRNMYNSTDESQTDRLFLIGGFASWPQDDPRYDGERTRNDIYSSEDGKNWTKLPPPFNKDENRYELSQPWGARGWHGCVTFHHPDDRAVDVSTAAFYHYNFTKGDGNEVMHPRMWIMAGGYIGTKRNHIVRKMEGYVDMWWSRDGIEWTRVNYKESSGPALYTTQDWSKTTVEGLPIRLGKWGFTTEVFWKSEDLNGNGLIDNEIPNFDFGGRVEGVDDNDEIPFWRKFDNYGRPESKVPSIYIIGGDTVDAGSLVNDVFTSQPGILCEQDGVTCSDQGVCGPGTMGCVCDSLQWIGEYCNVLNDKFKAAAWTARPGTVGYVLSGFVTLAIFFGS